MESKKVYDYLAQIYFGKKEEREKNFLLKILLSLNIILLSAVLVFLFVFPQRRGKLNIATLKPSLELTSIDYPLRFEYDFSSSGDTSVLRINLPRINLTRFDTLRVSLRSDTEKSSILGLVLKNSKNEESSVYIEGIGRNWQDFDIPLEKFSKVTDFSDVDNISFKIERWNTTQERGSFFIERICFLDLKRG